MNAITSLWFELVGHRILPCVLFLSLPLLLMHICACLFSIFLEHSSQSGKLISEWGFPLGSNRAGHVCYIVCIHPYYYTQLPLLAVRFRVGLALGRGKSQGWAAGLPTLAAWPDSGLGRGGTEPCQELSLRAPVLRPSRPGSVTVTCVGAGHVLPYQKLWQLLQSWGWLPSLPTHTDLQGSSSFASHWLSSAHPLMSIVQCVYLLWQIGEFWRN